jgi:hypothetical protein
MFHSSSAQYSNPTKTSWLNHFVSQIIFSYTGSNQTLQKNLFYTFLLWKLKGVNEKILYKELYSSPPIDLIASALADFSG